MTFCPDEALLPCATNEIRADSVPPGRYDVVFSVFDAAGNQSNEVSFFINVAEIPQGGTLSRQFVDRLLLVR
jgi:hypothetical protein